MQHIKALALALLAMFALAAVAASSASATELALGPAFLIALCSGPRVSPLLQIGFLSMSECLKDENEQDIPAWTPYYVDRERLEFHELAKVVSKNLGDFSLVPENTTLEPTTLCSGLSSPTLLFGGTPGTSETTIEFTGCEATSSLGGSKCDALSLGATPGDIIVKANDELVYVGTKLEAEMEEGHLGDLFTPAGGGNTFVTLIYLKLSGGSCPTGAVTTPVLGSVVGLVEPVNTMSSQGMLTFPAKAISKAWQWLSKGKVHEVKSELKAFGGLGATQVGLADLELESGEEWGVLTA